MVLNKLDAAGDALLSSATVPRGERGAIRGNWLGEIQWV
jgi:hypothetical protein